LGLAARSDLWIGESSALRQVWRVDPDWPDRGAGSAQYGYSYDALGRAALIEHQIAGLTPMVSFAQQFDTAGRRTRLAATVGSTADFLTDYVYDRLGRIDTIKQQGQGGAAVATKYVDFAFDAAGQPDWLKRYAERLRTGFRCAISLEPKK